MKRLPHPAVIVSGPQLDKVIEELEAGTCPQPEDAIWRDDLPRELAIRLAKATGATDEQIAEIIEPACRYCGKKIRRSGRLADGSPAYATPAGLDPAADGHPWYCDNADAPDRRHAPPEG